MQINVTVIIPVYNMQKYLRACLDSVVNQSVAGLEIITINDGSTDDSLEILKEYAAVYRNIYIYTQKNQGQAAAKNYGITHAKGKYVLFMDPDDYYPNNECIEKMYELSQEGNYDMCGGIMLHDNNGSIEVTDKSIVDAYYTNKMVNIYEYPDIYHYPRFMFKREFLIDNNLLFPLYKRYEDPPFTLNALCIAKNFYATNYEVYVYRIGYKKIQYTKDLCLDVLKGIKDVVQICLDNHIDIIYNKLLYRISKDYTVPIYKYLYCGFEEIDSIVKQIFDMLQVWDKNNTITYDQVRILKEESLKQYNQIKNILKGNNKIILYGAGGITKIFLESFAEYSSNIEGIAVTKNAEKIKVENMIVRNIEQYEQNDQNLVIVTTLEKYHKEIKKHLIDLGFHRIIIPDISKIRLADSMIND